MDREWRIESLQRAYAGFPNVQKMLGKLAAANFAELQEFINEQLGHLERVALELEGWGPGKRAQLEESSGALYDSIVRLERKIGETLSNMPVGRPN